MVVGAVALAAAAGAKGASTGEGRGPETRCVVNETAQSATCDRTCANSLCFLRALSGAEVLRSLAVTGHGMSEVAAGGLSPVPALQSLSLRGNRLARFHPRALEPLRGLLALDLASNALTELAIAACPVALADLDASANALRALRLAPCAALRRLVLRDNHLAGRALEAALASSSLAVLDVSFNPVGDDLAFVRRLPALETLALSHCAVSSLPPDVFVSARNLTTLRLDGNRLTAFDGNLLASLPNLRTLDLSSNALATLPPTPHNLQRLDLSSNNIGNQLHFLRYLPELKDLRMTNCSVSQLAPNVFGGNPKVEALFFDENLLSGVDPAVFADLSRLRLIALRRNRLPFIDLSSVSTEQRVNVYLDGNILEAFKSPSSVKVLHLTANQLQNNLSFLENAEGLVDLWLADNNITDVNPHHFKRLQNLQRLCLQNNSISDVSFLKHLNKLRTLSLSNNSISSVPHDVFLNMCDITNISLNDNKISNPDFLECIPSENMIYLRLSNNRLGRIGSHFTAWDNLRFLRLDRNNISIIDSDFSSLTSLIELDLEYNKFTYLHPNIFEGSPIKSLFLSGNNLTNAAFLYRLKNLETLSLSEMTSFHFRERDFSQLHHLKTIKLQGNSLKSIDFVKNFPLLETLDVSRNNISRIPENCFEGHCKLKSVVLEGNPLKDLSFDSSVSSSFSVIVGNRTFQSDDLKSGEVKELCSHGPAFRAPFAATGFLFSWTLFHTVRLYLL